MNSDPRKSVPDRILTAMITRTLYVAENEGLELTSRDIHDFISSNTFYYESPETDQYGRPKFSGDYSYDNLPALRKALVYCRHAGYISKHGSGRPYTFQLTTEGRLYSQDPFFKYNLKMAYMRKLIDEIVSRTLSNDEHVNELAEQKKRVLCKTCKLNHPKAQRLPARTWTVKPHRGKIGIQRPDGQIIEVPVTDEGVIKELEDLKVLLVRRADGSIDKESTILSLQNRCTTYEKIMKEAGIEIGRLDNQLTKVKGRKGKLDAKKQLRGLSRMEVAHWYLNNNMYLDAEFFEIWSGSLVVVEYERLLKLDGILNRYYDIQSTKSEIMTRTDFSKRILEPEEIHNIEIHVIEIRGGSIIVDSPYFQATKSLVV